MNWKKIFLVVKKVFGIEQKLEESGVIPKNKITDKADKIIDSVDSQVNQ